ncbi:uncharacterized protein N7487_000095 [Penicillium crustosum]|uniref:uncharacterized protein n=1 Tax=Penicillium crustosum TaxID=36656 RepID=UPI00238B1E38|nr:uncharacterized protein N7487_000095 [Penicillium crustosum]KAJ5416545.1 hypothetical protein N7487_000095 [Penicillium crustosum]
MSTRPNEQQPGLQSAAIQSAYLAASCLLQPRLSVHGPHTLHQWYLNRMILLPVQHSEQQPGLQFTVIQHQNPPTSLFLLLCDDGWKILPTGSVADAGSPWCLLSQESHLSSVSICLPHSPLPATTTAFCAWLPYFTSNRNTFTSLNSHSILEKPPRSWM